MLNPPRARRTRPISPPSSEDNSTSSRAIADFFSQSLPPTPPRSLPISPPASPTTATSGATDSNLRGAVPILPSCRKVAEGAGQAKGKVRASIAGQPRAGAAKTATVGMSAGSRKVTTAASRLQEQEDLRKRYELDKPTSPILPKVKLGFPTIFSDDEDDVEGVPDWRSAMANGGTGRAKTWSQTTTTTTTRRTERRLYRNSLPGGATLAFDDPPEESIPPPYSSRQPSATRPTSSYIPFPKTSATGFFSSSTNASPSGSNSSSTPRPRHHSSSSSRRSQAANNPNRRSFPGSFSFSSFSSSALPSSQSLRSTRPSLFSYASSSSSSTTSDQPQYRSTLTTLQAPESLLPYFKPFINLFFVLFISAVAFCSIGSVLVAGFTLTFYDDSIKRIEDFRKGLGEGQERIKGSIEGVKSGVGKLVGGAVEKWAGAKSFATSSAPSSKRSSRGYGFGGGGYGYSYSAKQPCDSSSSAYGNTSGSSFDPASTSTEHTDSFSSSSPSSFFSRYASTLKKPTSSQNIPRGRSRTPRNRPTSSNLHRSSFSHRQTLSSGRFSHPSASSSNRSSEAGWTSDENPILPYDVPHPSPSVSRSPSPDSNRTGGNGGLPPRPPLRILVPSIVLALLWTIWRIARGAWNNRKGGAEKGKGKARERRRNDGIDSGGED
ncbi:hypothetical protein P7C70_g3851, partial [Phenoliferia sp. Uapishka_3]